MRINKCKFIIKQSWSNTFCVVGDIGYIFGDQTGEDKYSNDLFTIKFEIDPNFKSNPKAIISEVEINDSIKPKVRASHCCVVHKDQYLIITEE